MEGTAPFVAMFIVVIVLILYGSYLASRFIASGSRRMSQSKGMKIVDRILVGKDSSIAVIKVGGRLFLVGISPSSISFITELSEEDIPDALLENGKAPVDFKKAFYEKYTGIFKK